MSSTRHPPSGAGRPLVSAIIATYNGADFVAQTIESALAQTWRPLEVIVVDDGSSDGTPDVLAGYADRVRVVRQENSGVSCARNAGAALSSGEFIAFLDHDDLWEPDMVERQVAVLQRQPDCGLVYGDSWIIDSEGVIQGRRRDFLEYAEGQVHANLLRGNFIPIETTVMRSALFDELGGFDPSLRYLEDYELYLRIAARHPVAFQPNPVARYRIHGRNLSHDLEALLIEWVMVLDRLLRQGTLAEGTLAEGATGTPAGPQRRLIESERARRSAEVAWQAVRRGDLGVADDWIRRAGRRCPLLLRARVLAWRSLLGVLPDPLARRALRMLPRRRLYGV